MEIPGRWDTHLTTWLGWVNSRKVAESIHHLRFNYARRKKDGCSNGLSPIEFRLLDCKKKKKRENEIKSSLKNMKLLLIAIFFLLIFEWYINYLSSFSFFSLIVRDSLSKIRGLVEKISRSIKKNSFISHCTR